LESLWIKIGAEMDFRSVEEGLTLQDNNPKHRRISLFFAY
jgi:hypothetical protein